MRTRLNAQTEDKHSRLMTRRKPSRGRRPTFPWPGPVRGTVVQVQTETVGSSAHCGNRREGHSSVTSASRHTRCALTSGSSLVTFAPVPSWSRTFCTLHVRTRPHEVKFVCRLQSKYDLTKHRPTHVHNLPHMCEVCGKKT